MTREEIIKSMSLQDAIQVFKDTNCYGTMDIAKSVILKALEQVPTVDLDKLKRKILMEVDGGTDDYWLRHCDVCKRISNSIDAYKGESEDDE